MCTLLENRQFLLKLYIYLPKDTNKNAHSHIISSSLEMELHPLPKKSTQMSINKGINKEIVTFLYNEIPRNKEINAPEL